MNLLLFSLRINAVIIVTKEFHQSSLEDNTRPKDASGRRANPLRITVDTREPTMLCLMLLNVYKRAVPRMKES